MGVRIHSALESSAMNCGGTSCAPQSRDTTELPANGRFTWAVKVASRGPARETDRSKKLPLSERKSRIPLHRRQITIDAFECDDGRVELEALLVDTKPFDFVLGAERPNVVAGEPIHRIMVRLTVDENAVIQATEIAMDATPYHYCREVETRFNLNGIKIGNGFAKAVSERIGAADNCWHVQQVLPQMATAYIQATFPATRQRINQLPPDERPAPAMLNTCVGWQSHRAHVRDEHPVYYQSLDKDNGRSE
jgi:hypothetical protein